MATKAVRTQGTTVYIGRGDANTTIPSADTFDEIGEVANQDGPGGSADVIDATHFKSAFKEKRMGIPDEGQVTLRVNWVPSDAGQISFRQARKDGELRNFRIVYDTDETPNQADFTAFAMSNPISGGVNSKWDATLTMEISGEVSWSDAA